MDLHRSGCQGQGQVAGHGRTVQAWYELPVLRRFHSIREPRRAYRHAASTPPRTARSSTAVSRSCSATAATSSGGPWSRPSSPGPKPSKKGAAARTCPCGATGRTQGERSSTAVMTAPGPIGVCCGPTSPARAAARGGHIVDRLLGLDGFLTRQATRLVCLLGGQDRLRRRRRDARGVLRLDRQRRDDPPGLRGRRRAGSPTFRAIAGGRRRAFAEAAGDVEFQTRRHQGQHDRGLAGHEDRHLRPPRAGRAGHRGGVGQPGPAGADGAGGVRGDRADRRLRPPDRRVGGPAGDDRPGGDHRRWATGRSGSGTPRPSSCAGSSEVLDIYHAAEHISDAGKGLFGEGTAAAKPGWRRAAACCCPTAGPGSATTSGRRWRSPPSWPGTRRWATLTGYFAAHTGRLNYCHRLYTGQSIGSGMVEGAAKNLIGRRLKQTGPAGGRERQRRWPNLCCLTYSDHWDLYWASPN